MPSAPIAHSVTFPGTVRIEPVKGEKPLKTFAVKNKKTGEFVGTRVVVPDGKRLVYELTHHVPKSRSERPKKPHAVVKVVDAGEVEVTHAELELEHEETERTVQHGYTTRDDGKREPAEMTVVDRKLKSVTATSIEHPELAGQGATPEEAVANMKEAIKTKLANKAAPETKPDVTRTATPEALPEIPVHEAPAEPPHPDTVTRQG